MKAASDFTWIAPALPGFRYSRWMTSTLGGGGSVLSCAAAIMADAANNEHRVMETNVRACIGFCPPWGCSSLRSSDGAGPAADRIRPRTTRLRGDESESEHRGKYVPGAAYRERTGTVGLPSAEAQPKAEAPEMTLLGKHGYRPRLCSPCQDDD